MSFKVKYVALDRSYNAHKKEIDETFSRVMSTGSFILRDDVKEFEQSVSEFLGSKYAVGVNSGSDALFLSCKIANLKAKDEVITVGHTFVATVSAIVQCGATPVLVDIGNDFNIDVEKIENSITNKTKAIIPVHLNGRACDMNKIIEIASKYNLIVIEDACQSVGAKYNNKNVGTFGRLGCFSLHPMKSLNCAGDGGYIVTNNKDDYNRLISLRNHGQSSDKLDIYEYGYSSRLDNLQAAIANIRLKDLKNNNERRREIATEYYKELKDLPIILPKSVSLSSEFFDVYNSYVIRTDKRDELYKFLRLKGIEVFTHMYKPLSDYPHLKLNGDILFLNKEICKEIISLPIYPELQDSEVSYIINTIKEFYK